MPFPYYTGRASRPLDAIPADLTFTRPKEQKEPGSYIPSPGLVDAVNGALLLGQPLLLTGEPGTGKTHLAYSVSWELGFKEPSPLIYETKSTSTARDLFYSYDTLARFHAAQTRHGSQDSRAYINYNALGMAILLANDEAEVRQYFPLSPASNAGSNDFQPETTFAHGGKRRSVVLIDEIDKAPRDFPNDLLNEVENMYFKVPELGNAVIRAEEQWRPVVIITSNSEKNLPDAFLRRCIYYNIPFPEKTHLKQIVESRITHFRDPDIKWLNEAIELFYKLRAPNSPLVKKPATAELLGWLTALHKIFKTNNIPENTEKILRKYPKIIDQTLSVLVKNEGDTASAKSIVSEWLK
jgi:MoxR-like ATPase